MAFLDDILKKLKGAGDFVGGVAKGAYTAAKENVTPMIRNITEPIRESRSLMQDTRQMAADNNARLLAIRNAASRQEAQRLADQALNPINNITQRANDLQRRYTTDLTTSQGRKNVGRVALDATRGVGYLYGAARLSPKTVLNPLNLGISAATSAYASSKGVPFSEALGYGMGQMPFYSGTARLTNPALNRIARAVPGSKTLTSALTGSILNVGQGLAQDVTQGNRPTVTSIGLDALMGAVGGRNQFSDTTSNLRMGKSTMNEVIKAEDMLLHPERYVTVRAHTAKNRAAITKIEVDKIRNQAVEIIDRIAAKHLPTKVLDQTAGDTKAQIKALIDLNSQNRLTNVSYLTNDTSRGKNVRPSAAGEVPKTKGVGGEGVTPKTVRVWVKSKFSNDGGYRDVPVIRKEENITLYQGGNGEKRQFWTPDKKYAEQFGNVTEKTGTFYQVDNGNRVTNVYVEAPASPSKGVGGEGVRFKTINEGGVLKEVEGRPVKLVDGVETFIHQGDNPRRTVKGFVVSEKSTGRYIATGETEREAIANAQNLIKGVGEDRFKEKIASLSLSKGVGTIPNLEVPKANLPPTRVEKPRLPTLPERVPTAKTGTSPIFPESTEPSNRLLPETPTRQSQRLDKILSEQTTEKVPSTDIIQQAKGQIGSMPSKAEKPLKQQLRDFYTNWVNRFQPLEDVATQIEKETKSSILPQNDPRYTTRQLLGAGAVAEQRHQKVLQPILDELGDVPSSDFDVFLKAKRDLNLGERGVRGSDATQAQQVIDALSQKYDVGKLESVAQKLYAYQDEGLVMLREAGIISPEVYAKIKDTSKNYVPFQRVMEEVDNYLGLPTKKAYVGSQPVQKIKGSERQILSPVESIIANTYKIESAVSRNRVAQSLVNLRQVAPQYADMFERVGKDGADTIAVWEGGRKNFYRVGEDIARAVKGLNEENVGILTKILSVPAQVLRQGATGRNIDFVIPNAFKDQFDAAITSKYGYKPFVDYFRGLAHLINYKRTGSDELVEEWINSGGKIFFENMGGRKQIGEQIQQATQTKGLFKQIKDWAISGIDTLGELSETPTRLGLYQRAKEATGNSLIAMMESREGTLDFARMGAKMKTANSIIPFLNVGVQGFDKLIRAAKDHPGKMALNMTLYAGMPQLMVSLYNNVFHPDEYANVPQWEKDTNFIIITGTNQDGKPKYLKIPKGNIVPLIANPTDQLVSYLAGTNKQGFGQMALSLLTDVAPVLESGTNLQEVFTKTLGSNLPQAIKPVFENAFNKSTFYTDQQGKPQDIVPYYLEQKPAYLQFKKSTPEVYQVLGKILNVSPLKAQNFLEGYLSGFIKTPVNISQVLQDVSQGKPVDPNKIPVLRRFYGEREDYYTSSTPEKEDSRFAATAAEPSFLQRLFKQGVTEEQVQQLPTDTKDLAVIYEEAKRDFDSYKEKRLKIEYGNYEDWEKQSKLEELDSQYQYAKQMVDRIEKEQPEAVLEMNLELYSSAGSRTVEERSAWAAEALSKATDKEGFERLVDRMLEAKVLTKSVVEALREQGIDINRYTEGGKVKTIGGSGSGKSLKSIASILKAIRQDNEAFGQLSAQMSAPTKRPTALSMVLNQSRTKRKPSASSIDAILAKRRQEARTPLDRIRTLT